MGVGLRLLVVTSLTFAFTAIGCGGKGDADATGGSGTETNGIPPASTGGGPGGNDTTAGSVGDADGTAANDSTTAATTADATGATGATGGLGGGLDCAGTVYACTDGMDNDGDGYIDLLDPECTGPCDDDEGSFQTGLPGDNMDCKQDCFFDGNSGQGDDGCIWDLRCDPANPGELIGCEYTGGMNCDNQPPNQDKGCIEFCEPFVPPGCDCFGCCEVQLPGGGSVHIFLNSSEDCALDNLEACTECTSQIEDCGNPCVPEECQVCFGETEPPEGCGDPVCPGGDPCDADGSDCPEGFFCYLSCCYPPPPG